MFETIPSASFGLNYDPSHMILQMMDYIAPLYEFKDRLFHMHAKDMRIDRDRIDAKGVWDLGYGWATPKIPGLGDIDWNRFVSALADVGYDGPFCVEVEDEAFSGEVARRKKSLEISRNVLRPLVG
jgi:sugar phosphate isomerase/epimerase